MDTSFGASKTCSHCGSPLPANVLKPSLEGPLFCCSACEWLAQDDWVQKLPSRKTPDRWLPYNDPSIWKSFEQGQDEHILKFHLHLEGLQCSSCVHLLEKLPEYDSRIQSVRVRYGHSDLFLSLHPDAEPGWVASLIEDLGYTPHFLRADESAEQLQHDEERSLLRRIAVAGACSGNIMLFTIPLYAGLNGSWKQIFEWLSALLFLPILFYAALPFYRGAWASLRTKRLSVDLPLTIALLGGFFASLWNLLRGSPELYFDSSAGFLFFILISRWFLRKSHRRWIQTEDPLPWAQQIYQVKSEEGHLEKKLVSQLEIGDLVQLEADENLPADGILESPFAVFDTALINGEAFPRTLQKGQKTTGGFRNLSPHALIRITQKASDSEIAKAWSEAQKEALYKGRKINRFDRASQVLLAVVVGTGALIFAGAPFFGLGLEDAFQRALALWIVACPCALAFGGPLAYAIALRKAAQLGILIKSPDVFDRLVEVQSIAFDKTGTLTEGRLKLLNSRPAEIPSVWKSMILGLELNSYHPIANAFRAAWLDQAPVLKEPAQVHEMVGSKVFGLFDHKVYSLQGSLQSREKLCIEFRQDQNRLAEFEFEDVLRVEAPLVVERLKKHYDLFLLSGDTSIRAQRVGHEVGIHKKNIRGSLSPSDKANWIAHSEKTMMVGDGANDGPAFAKAHLAVAMSGALEQSLRLADVYLIKGGLSPVLDLFEISQSVQKTLRRNLIFALIYNLAAGFFAIAGMMNPLIAAVLMPLSSLLILYSTWEGTR